MTRPPSISDILQAVERVTGVTIAELRSDRQSCAVITARKLAYFVASQCFNISQRDIAAGMNRERSSIANAINKLTAATEIDPELVDKVEEEVERMLAGRAGQASSQVEMR